MIADSRPLMIHKRRMGKKICRFVYFLWWVGVVDCISAGCSVCYFQNVNHIIDLFFCSLGENNPHTCTFLGFSVYISNTTNKEDGVLCFRDTHYTRATIPTPVNITCPSHGRYVIYNNDRTPHPYPEWYSKYAWIELCEVEVYGEKPADYTPM